MTTPEVQPSFWTETPHLDLLLSKYDDGKIPGNKITEQQVGASATLRSIADAFVIAYRGRFELMISLQGYISKGYTLSDSQRRAALNTLLRCYDRKKQADAEMRQLADANGLTLTQTEQQALQNGSTVEQALEQRVIAAQRASLTQAPEPVTPVVKDGTYTIVLDEQGTYRTLQVVTIEDAATLRRYNNPQGTQIVKYLSGPDNEANYTLFATLKGEKAEIIRGKGDSLSTQALSVLINAGSEQRIDYGAAYAMQSGRCWRCGRKLTVPASLHRGMGPICAEKL